MPDPILNCKSNEEVKELVELEHDKEEFRRLLKQAPLSLMARIKLFHKFGYGDCECNNCVRE